MVLSSPLILLPLLFPAAAPLPVTGADAQKAPVTSVFGVVPDRLAYLQPPEAQPPAAEQPPVAEPAPAAAEERRGRSQLALRIGGAGPYYGGLLTGLDVTLRQGGIVPGWTGRVDLDNWGISILGSSSSGTAVTLSQISSTGSRVPDVYYGLGLGFASMSDDDDSDAGLIGKLILGLNLGGHMALEGNVLVGGVTNVVGALRMRF